MYNLLQVVDTNDVTHDEQGYNQPAQSSLRCEIMSPCKSFVESFSLIILTILWGVWEIGFKKDLSSKVIWMCSHDLCCCILVCFTISTNATVFLPSDWTEWSELQTWRSPLKCVAYRGITDVYVCVFSCLDNRGDSGHDGQTWYPQHQREIKATRRKKDKGTYHGR